MAGAGHRVVVTETRERKQDAFGDATQRLCELIEFEAYEYESLYTVIAVVFLQLPSRQIVCGGRCLG